MTSVWWGSIFFGVASALINLPIVERPVARPAAAAGLKACAGRRCARQIDEKRGRPDVAKFKAIVVEKAEKGQRSA